MKDFKEKDELLFKEVQKMMDGDFDTYNIVYEMSEKYIYKIIFDIVKNHTNVEDIMQDTYITIFNKISSLREANSFYSWAGRIATNNALQFIKKNNREVLVFEGEDEDGEGDGDFIFDRASMDNEGIIPESVLMEKEQQRLLANIIDNLPIDQKLCIQYFYFEEMSVQEIATQMECSTGTIKSRLNYARKTIKDAVVELDVKHGTRLYSLGGAASILLLLFKAGVEDFVIGGATVAGSAASGAVAVGTGVSMGNAEGAVASGVAIKSGEAVAGGVVSTAGGTSGATVGGAVVEGAGKVAVSLTTKATATSVFMKTVAIVASVVSIVASSIGVEAYEQNKVDEIVHQMPAPARTFDPSTGIVTYVLTDQTSGAGAEEGRVWAADANNPEIVYLTTMEPSYNGLIPFEFTAIDPLTGSAPANQWIYVKNMNKIAKCQAGSDGKLRLWLRPGTYQVSTDPSTATYMSYNMTLNDNSTISNISVADCDSRIDPSTVQYDTYQFQTDDYSGYQLFE